MRFVNYVGVRGMIMLRCKPRLRCSVQGSLILVLNPKVGTIGIRGKDAQKNASCC